MKPSSGPNADLVFEATSQQELDDDVESNYCGVLYFYDDQKVYLYAANSGTSSGQLFCTG